MRITRIFLCILFFLFAVNVDFSFASYSYDKSITTSGGGTWGSILKLQVSISGSTATFTISKQSGTFTTTSSGYIRYDSYTGTTAASGTVYAGTSSKSFSVNLNSISSYPHNFYGYVRNSEGGYAYVGPIKIDLNLDTPSAPNCSATGPNSIYLYWSSVSSASKYKIYRSESSSGTYKQISCQTSTSYTDSGIHLSPNTRYYYKVQAGTSAADCALYTTSGWSSYSSYGSARTLDVSITVTYPNGGEIFYSGNSYTIRWTSSNVSGNVKISYSTNDGISHQTITSSTSNDGSYVWNVPSGIQSNKCYISIASVNDGDIWDHSDTAFTIASASIQVNYPDGGETLSCGNTYTIRWSSSNVSGNVKISYCPEGDAPNSYITIISSTANDGEYEWTIPQGINSSQCYIAVGSVNDPDVWDHSNSIFTITPIAIHVTTPNGGEILSCGYDYTIQWSSNLITGNVKISYSTDDGVSYHTIISNTSNDGEFNWEIPQGITSTRCYIGIASVNNTNIWDHSDTTFTITSASLQVLSPNGGETFSSGNSYTVRWTSSNVSGGVRISYTTQGDTPNSYSSIVSSTENDGEYLWHIPTGIDSTECYLAVGSNDIANLWDHSDAMFTITPLFVHILSPNGGESWAGGSTHSILWESSNITGDVCISYSIDGDSPNSYTRITDSTPNDGEFPWPLPEVVSDKCRVAVGPVNNKDIWDHSDNLFSITAASNSPVISSVFPLQVSLDQTNFYFDIYGEGFSNQLSSYPRVWIEGIALENVTADDNAPAIFLNSGHLRIKALHVYDSPNPMRDIALRNNTSDTSKTTKASAIEVLSDYVSLGIQYEQEHILSREIFFTLNHNNTIPLTITALAEECAECTYVYSWEASGGNLEYVAENVIIWTPPSDADDNTIYTITCTVGDSLGNIAVQTLTTGPECFASRGGVDVIIPFSLLLN